MGVQRTDGVITISTPRPEDADAVAEAVRGSIETLSPWMHWATPDYDAESAREWIRGAQEPGVDGFCIRLADGTIIGSCGLQHYDAPNRCIELGYWIGTAYTGNGYATRAARLLIGYAFDALDVHRVTILVSEHNERSQRVAERLAGPREAVLKDRLFARNQWHDACVYGVLAETS
jgi:RimJ/RimL family protein N-acetyltransferase